MRHAGFTVPAKYALDLAAAVSAFRARPGNRIQSVAEASFEAWIKFYRSDENSYNVPTDYYTKGALLAHLLNIEIADRTGGARGLDDVMRLIWQRAHDEGAAFGTADIRAVCEEVAGSSMTDFFQRYVYGTAEMPFEQQLPKAGYRLIVDERRTSRKRQNGYLGVSARLSGGRLTVSRVLAGGPAWEQGLNYGDEILALDGERLSDPDGFEDGIRNHSPGDAVELSICRNGVIRAMRPTLGRDENPVYKLEKVSEPSELQLAVRRQWLPERIDTEEN